MARIHVADIEEAINYWRHRTDICPGEPLGAELEALAQLYARMAMEKCQSVDEMVLNAQARAAWMAWYASTPDTPCIAICSTAQGDALCKGCGRRFDEVQNWLTMTPTEKRWVWARICSEGSAWRFTRYAERALELLPNS